MKNYSRMLSALLVLLAASACASGSSGVLSTPATGTPRRLSVGTPMPGNLARISPANAGQVTQLARWGGGTFAQAVASPRGDLLAVASAIGVDLLDAATLEPVRFIATQAAVTCLAFSPDGKRLAGGMGDGSLQLWRVADGRLLFNLIGHTDKLLALAFSPNGRTLAFRVG